MDRDVHVITLAGYLDISRYPEFRAAFEAAPPGKPALLDLRGASGVDAIFLTELLLFRRRQRAPVVVLIGTEGPLTRVFAALDIAEKIVVTTHLGEAMAALSRP
jgi:anti-anti-sigma regulatory factor